MTEDEARAWIATQLDVPRETWAKLERYVALLRAGMESQNLIAESTWPHVWARHITDSAQLIPLAREAVNGNWIDLGSGAGLPGLVAAMLGDRPVLLVESRRLRAAFLTSVKEELSLANVTVHHGKVQHVPSQRAAVVSARAYAPLHALLGSAEHLSGDKTLWLLPKGRNAQIELEAAHPAWQGVFHVEPSVTDAESAIIVARSVAARRMKGGT
ncbi:MAG: 16S rRNA (guanine(527)-N(7))-methyltransferase RsmG [Sphingobium sp.]